MNPPAQNATQPARRRRLGFSDDFRRFFTRGLAALLPTLITIYLLVKLWAFLWEALGQQIIWSIKRVWLLLGQWELVPYQPAGYIDRHFDTQPQWQVQILGVGLSILLVYIVGLFVGNIIGRTGWRILERGLMRIPLVKAIFPAVKQVTDFLLGDKEHQLKSASRVVACQPHANGIWSIGLVTGTGLRQLSDATQREMVTVFVPSTPTAFAGYVMVVPRDEVVELPLSVEDALRMLATFGVASGAHAGEENPPRANRPMISMALPGLAASGTPPDSARAGGGTASSRGV